MTTTIYSVQILPEGSEHRFVLVELVCDDEPDPDTGIVPEPTKRPVGFAKDYDAILKFIPDGLEWHDRDPRDPPSIVETWEPPQTQEVQHDRAEPGS